MKVGGEEQLFPVKGKIQVGGLHGVKIDAIPQKRKSPAYCEAFRVRIRFWFLPQLYPKQEELLLQFLPFRSLPLLQVLIQPLQAPFYW